MLMSQGCSKELQGRAMKEENREHEKGMKSKRERGCVCVCICVCVNRCNDLKLMPTALACSVAAVAASR